ncbi:MAG: LPS export ABC transporter permease LptG [Candidatus Omnitrophica bacterium]|nr:LPS export ABC transporter permease LptG [Candidatus Omnitrophota bacterium]HOX53943.1 LPS export ABC transporter permease LptG [Candidatus Omnitrophota bacterium]
MRILDRYILKSIVTIFLGALLVFLTLYLVVDILGHLDEFLREKVSPLIIWEYYASFLPIIFVQTAPIAILLAILATFSKLNVNNEIVAMRSAGINIWQLTKQTVLFAFIVSIFIFWVNENIIPQAMQTSDKIKMEKIEGKASLTQKEKINNVAYFGKKNRLYFINSFDPKTLTMEGITILEQDKNQELKEKNYALKGIWKNRKWVFSGIQVFSYDKNGAETSEFIDEKTMDIPETPTDFMTQRVQVDYMNIRQLEDYKAKLADSGAKSVIRNLNVDIQQRFAYPFGSLVIVFVGLPFSLMIKKRKGMTFASFGVCMLIGFLYYLTNAISIALGKSDIFPPIMAGWLANVLFLIIGLVLLKKTS